MQANLVSYIGFRFTGMEALEHIVPLHEITRTSNLSRHQNIPATGQPLSKKQHLVDSLTRITTQQL